MKSDMIINQKVAILCDGNNIERSIQEQNGMNTMVNFDTLVSRLLNGRGLNRLIYFREGRNISHKLADRLHENFFGSVVPCHKSADIPLSIKATQLASKVDTIIIMSGDSDYVDLVRHLRSEGVRVEIAAVEKTTAKILREEADYFHPITKKDLFTYKSGGRVMKKQIRKSPVAANSPASKSAPAKPAPEKTVSKPAAVKATSAKSPAPKAAPSKPVATKTPKAAVPKLK